MIVFFQFWNLLERKEKFYVFILFTLMLFSACLELIGIGLIMPIIVLLSRPELMVQNKYFKILKQIINPSSNNNFILIICFIIIILFILKNSFLALQNYIQAKFIFKKGADISNKLFKKYILAPYSFHLENNSGELIGILHLCAALCQSTLMPGMIILTELIIVISIIFMLLFTSTVITLSFLGITILIGTLFFLPFQNVNYKLGKKRLELEIAVNKISLQGLKSIKDTKILNIEDFFLQQYNNIQKEKSKVFACLTFLNNFPRFFIEAFVIISGMGALIILLTLGKNIGSIILLISLFTVSLIRLMPSMSRIQYNISIIKQIEATFDVIQNDIQNISEENKVKELSEISFKNKIKIKNLTFSYKKELHQLFRNFNLEIPHKSSVAFVGPTGSGKTTLVDIILGLIKPNSGEILVDGVNIEKNLLSWQKKIGYVPQFIYLLDDTIKSNVAFGISQDKIDDKRVRECLATAQILNFVESLPEGLNTVIGENGIRLSGGQRQRIGIARALYHNPEILILDEATSSLDNDTEKAVIDALKILHGKLTIIIVAHRLTTVQNCDKIVEIKQLKYS